MNIGTRIATALVMLAVPTLASAQTGPSDFDIQTALRIEAAEQNNGDGSVDVQSYGVVAQLDSRGRPFRYVAGNAITVEDALICRETSTGALTRCLSLVAPTDDGMQEYECNDTICECDNSGSGWWPWSLDCIAMTWLSCNGDMWQHPSNPDVWVCDAS